MDESVISKLLEVDPQFSEFLDRLYGVSKMNDTSEVHSPGSPDQDKGKKALAGGLLFGTAAEGTAASRAVQSAVKAKPVAPPVGVGGIKGTLKRVAESPGGKRGEAALQIANLAVGLGAARELLKKPNQGQVTKAAGHFQPASLVRSNARFRALGTRAVPSTARPGAVSTVGTQPNKGHVSLVAKGRFNPLRGAADAGKMAREFSSSSARYGAGYRAGKGEAEATAAERAREAATTARAGKFRAVRRTAAVAAPAGAAAGVAGTLQAQKQRKAKVAKAEWTGEIQKFDTDKRQVFGWASLSKVDGEPVADRQGDYIPIEEAEASAYHFMLNSRKGGDMHSRIAKADLGPVHTADIIESFVATPEKLEAMGLEPDALPLGWWIGMQVNDEEQWQKIKNGERTGFSVHGAGVRRDYVDAA